MKGDTEIRAKKPHEKSDQEASLKIDVRGRLKDSERTLGLAGTQCTLIEEDKNRLKSQQIIVHTGREAA